MDSLCIYIFTLSYYVSPFINQMHVNQNHHHTANFNWSRSAFNLRPNTIQYFHSLHLGSLYCTVVQQTCGGRLLHNINPYNIGFVYYLDNCWTILLLLVLQICNVMFKKAPALVSDWLVGQETTTRSELWRCGKRNGN